MQAKLFLFVFLLPVNALPDFYGNIFRKHPNDKTCEDPVPGECPAGTVDRVWTFVKVRGGGYCTRVPVCYPEDTINQFHTEKACTDICINYIMMR
uniref:Putative secreted protein n=1 Tax=Ornithodoros turicata TaxID=34597 RepID=A0A2R5L908_9ACAR